jgi:signal transduction histidine kinase
MVTAQAAPPWWRRDPIAELPLALLVTVVTVAGVAGELAGSPWPTPPSAIAYAIVAGGCLVLAWRRVRPGVVAVATTLVFAGYHLADYPGGAPIMALFVSVYALAAYGETIRSYLGAGVLIVAEYLILTLPPHPHVWTSPANWGPAFSLLCIALLGSIARQRRRQADMRVAQAAAVATAEVGQRLAEERLRVARDLHDVLAHTISVIAVHSGLALEALDDSPHTTKRSLVTIRSSAREAMSELRATLGLLRGERDAGQRVEPQLTLSWIPRLAASAEAAGLRTTVRIEPTDAEPPPLVQVTAVRVVQEALTNVIRHAGATTVDIEVRVKPDQLYVEVLDNGTGPNPTDNPGFGLRGMAERVVALGGTLHTGPGPDGGFRVAATLPC